MQEYIHGLGRLVEQHTFGPLSDIYADALWSATMLLAGSLSYTTVLVSDWSEIYICACITMAFCGEIYKYDVKGRPSDGIKDNI